jgi:hypothetical protein
MSTFISNEAIAAARCAVEALPTNRHISSDEMIDRALEAAAPLIKAQGLSEAGDAAFKDKGIQGLQRILTGNWLRAKAHDMWTEATE